MTPRPTSDGPNRVCAKPNPGAPRELPSSSTAIEVVFPTKELLRCVRSSLVGGVPFRLPHRSWKRVSPAQAQSANPVTPPQIIPQVREEDPPD